MDERAHIPVLLSEVLTYLDSQKGGLFLDGTFGAGGYTRALLCAHPHTRVIGFDRDPSALKVGLKMEETFSGRFTFVHDCFSRMASYLNEKADGLVLDLGVSSMQIDQPERGFSLRFDGPLDMRMAQEGLSAKDVVNGFSEKQIADILFKYGEEKAARRIARALVAERSTHPIITTRHLAEVIHRVMPKPKDGSDSATRSFQALRIFVNDELGELERALESSLSLLKDGGRLVIVSFHSLEDRIVKRFLIKHSCLKPNENRHMLSTILPHENIQFQVLTKKPVVPNSEELSLNPRAHSAKLRAALRVDISHGKKEKEVLNRKSEHRSLISNRKEGIDLNTNSLLKQVEEIKTTADLRQVEKKAIK